jgi:hypothetical protein
MTFNPLVPLNSDSPGIFPAQNQTNMTRLQTLLGADHQFNLTAAANDGWHNLIHMTQQAPSGALAATGRLYVKTAGSFVQLFYMDDNGREYQITPGIIAAVNFNGTGAVGLQSIRSALNVTSVDKTATGAYTINFTTPIATNNYVAVITGMRNSSGSTTNGFVKGSATYNNSVNASYLKIEFQGGTTSLNDVLMGNVLIYAVS